MDRDTRLKRLRFRAWHRGTQEADRLIGLARWAEFHFAAADRAAFAHPLRRWRLFVEAIGYRHESDPLSDDVRSSLLEDLG